MDARVLTDERRFLQTVKSCGPGAPTQALSLAEMIGEATVANSWFTGERGVGRKTIAQGRPE